jgi:hypothetical protein
MLECGCGVCTYSNTVQCVVRHSGTDGHATMYEPRDKIYFYVTVQYNALQCSAEVVELYMSDVAAEVYLSTDH